MQICSSITQSVNSLSLIFQRQSRTLTTGDRCEVIFYVSLAFMVDQSVTILSTLLDSIAIFVTKTVVLYYLLIVLSWDLYTFSSQSIKLYQVWLLDP